MGKEFQISDLPQGLAGKFKIAIFDSVGLYDEVMVDHAAFANRPHWEKQKQEIARRANDLKAEVWIVKEHNLFKICFYLKPTLMEISTLANYPICLN